MDRLANEEERQAFNAWIAMHDAGLWAEIQAKPYILYITEGPADCAIEEPDKNTYWVPEQAIGVMLAYYKEKKHESN